MVELSIVLPTCNRGRLLEKCISSIVSGTKAAFELIVVDGASNDTTTATLTEAGYDLGDRLKVIREEKREGFVRAANKGFRAATGRYLTWLNDDARIHPGTLDAAIEQLAHSPPDVAFVAMFHAWHSPKCRVRTASRKPHISPLPRPRDAVRQFPGRAAGNVREIGILRRTILRCRRRSRSFA